MIFQQILPLICVLLTKQSEPSPLLFGNQDIFTGSVKPRSPSAPSKSLVSNANNNINYASGGPISVMEKLMPCKRGCFKTPSMKCVCHPITIVVDYPDSDERAPQNEISTTSIPLDTGITKYELHTNSSNISTTTQNILNRSGLNLTVIKLQEEEEVTRTTDSLPLSSSTISSALLTNKVESRERTMSGVERSCFSLTTKIVMFVVILSMLYL